MAQELNVDVDQLGFRFSIARALNDKRVKRQDFDKGFEKFMYSDSMAPEQKVKMLATVVTRKGQRGGGHIPLRLQNKRRNFVGTVMEVRRINACHLCIHGHVDPPACVQHAREESHPNDDGDDAAASEHRHANDTEQLQQKMKQMEQTQEQIQRETNEICSKFKELAPKIDKLMQVASLLFDKLGGK